MIKDEHTDNMPASVVSFLRQTINLYCEYLAEKYWVMNATN